MALKDGCICFLQPETGDEFSDRTTNGNDALDKNGNVSFTTTTGEKGPNDRFPGSWFFSGAGGNVRIPIAGVGHPFSTISGSYAFYCVFRTQDNGGNWGQLMGSGADATGEAGVQLIKRDGAELYMYHSDGSTRVAAQSRRAYHANRHEDKWWVIVVNVDFTAGNNTRFWGNGWSFNSAGNGDIANISAVTTPITPHLTYMTLGSNDDDTTPNGDNLQGFIAACGWWNRNLTYDEVRYLCNNGLGRTWDEIDAFTGFSIEHGESGVSTENTVTFSFQSSADVTPVLYARGSNTVLQTGAAITPNSDGFCVGSFTGLSADTKYRVEGEVSGASEHVLFTKTIPADATSYAVLWGNCSDLIVTRGWENIRDRFEKDSDNVYALIHLGDQDYQNPGTETDERDDATLRNDFNVKFTGNNTNGDTGTAATTTADDSARQYANSWAMLIRIPSDHDAGPDDNEGSTNPVRDAVNRIERSWSPNQDRYRLSTSPNPLDQSWEIGRTKLILFDTRYSKNSSVSPKEMISSETMEWFKAEVIECWAQGKGLLLGMDNIWEHGGGGSEPWDDYPEQREEIFDTLALYLPDAVISLGGDQHMQGMDNQNHGWSATDPSYTLIHLDCGPFRANSTQYTTQTWDYHDGTSLLSQHRKNAQHVMGMLSFSESGDDVTVTIRFLNNDVNDLSALDVIEDASTRDMIQTPTLEYPQLDTTLSDPGVGNRETEWRNQTAAEKAKTKDLVFKQFYNRFGTNLKAA
jgi:hypothetical protein